ncbi:MAG TPA: radical SAM protein, partial [Anaerolineales bacterium]|nr:radical SAM protein [Anaerolineales bacterium]
LLDLLIGVGNRLIFLLFPFFRSRTGWENPRVRNITSLTYLLRGTWIVNKNLDRWRKSRAQLFPVVLQVQTINRCNGKCGMCPYPYTVHLQPREVMDDALFTKIVEECTKEEDFYEFVPMVQNEPLLDIRLEERIAEFKRHAQPHQAAEIVTNGTGLTPGRFEKLVKSGLDTITISLSAFSQATYEKLIEGLSWAQVTKNLEAVAASPALAKVNIFLRYVRQHGNESEFRPFKKYWEGRGLNVANYEINNRSGTLQEYETRQPVKSFLFKQARKSMGRKVFKGACPHAFGIMHVLANGDVPLCANDWHNRHILGNVRQQSIREIYNSPQMDRYRELMEQGRFDEIDACRDCSFWQEWLKPDTRPLPRAEETSFSH